MKKTVILTGPTATGKTGASLRFAKDHGRIEIINADSLLFYRDLDIGTAKPTTEERAGIPHHLIDVASPSETFTAGDFVKSVAQTRDEIHARGNRALIVGGSGFYLKALYFGLWDAPKSDPVLRAELDKLPNKALFQELNRADEATAARIGPNDRYRLIRSIEMIRQSGLTPSALHEKKGQAKPLPEFELFVIDRETTELESRIAERTRAMLAQGLIPEVENLKVRYPESRTLQAVGYAETLDYLEGRKPAGRKIPDGLPGLESEINLSTRQLVKRQRTWFRGQSAFSQNFLLPKDESLLHEKLKEAYA